MRATDKHLKTLLPKARRLIDVLEIIDTLVFNLRDEVIQFEAEVLVEVVRDIPKLNRYVDLSDKEFAKAILEEIGVTGKEVDEGLNDLFDTDEDDFNLTDDEVEEFIVSVPTGGYEEEYVCKIVDFSKCTNINAYAGTRVLAYDFIVKMQQKLWNGILHAYIKDINSTEIYTLQKFDADYIDSIMLDALKARRDKWTFKQNVISWAFFQGFIGVSEDVNIIYDDDNNQVIVNLDFSY